MHANADTIPPVDWDSLPALFPDERVLLAGAERLAAIDPITAHSTVSRCLCGNTAVLVSNDVVQGRGSIVLLCHACDDVIGIGLSAEGRH